MRSLGDCLHILDELPAFSGRVPAGFGVDFLGALTDLSFRARIPPPADSMVERTVTTRPPTLRDGEIWFEAVNWVLAAREARGRFTMMTLGAWYGAQAVGSYRALQAINPLPAKLVIVEAEPNKWSLIRQHLQINGIDPAQHWLVPFALSDTNAPVLFPVGSPGIGGHNCMATNDAFARAHYAQAIIERGLAERAIEDLLMRQTTSLRHQLIHDESYDAEIQLVSAITLQDLLGPFDRVDYLESDLQQSEALVFAPCMELLRSKVRRVHIGTHGGDVHRELVQLFDANGWEIVFDFAPDSRHETEWGSFVTSDGVLTAVNPNL